MKLLLISPLFVILLTSCGKQPIEQVFSEVNYLEPDVRLVGVGHNHGFQGLMCLNVSKDSKFLCAYRFKRLETGLTFLAPLAVDQGERSLYVGLDHEIYKFSSRNLNLIDTYPIENFFPIEGGVYRLTNFFVWSGNSLLFMLANNKDYKDRILVALEDGSPNAAVTDSRVKAPEEWRNVIVRETEAHLSSYVYYANKGPVAFPFGKTVGLITRPFLDYSPEHGWLFSPIRGRAKRSSDPIVFAGVGEKSFRELAKGDCAVWGPEGDVYFLMNGKELIRYSLLTGKGESLYLEPTGEGYGTPVMTKDKRLLGLVFATGDLTYKLVIFDLIEKEFRTLIFEPNKSSSLPDHLTFIGKNSVGYSQ